MAQPATRRTTNFVRANKDIIGTKVVNPQHEDLGKIEDLIVDSSGRVSYAVLSFGGFLGMGENYHPIPWAKLNYDRNLGGYVVDIDNKTLEGSPAYAAGASPRWGDEEYEEGLHRYYGAAPYWGDTWSEAGMPGAPQTR